MPVNANIYQTLKPVEMPSMFDSQQKAMTLSALGMQQARQSQDMDAAQRAAHMQKASIFGEALESIKGHPDKASIWPSLRNEMVQKGIIKPEDVTEQYDEGQYMGLLDRYHQSIPYLEKQHLKAQTNKLNADAYKDRLASGMKPGAMLTPGEKQADQAFAKDAADYYYGGGKATTEKNFKRLDDAMQKLRDKPNLTGGFTTMIPGLRSDAAQDVINPEMAAIRDEIRGAVQGSLRQTLGAQFTEKEGEAVFNRAFNPRLSADENIKRVMAEALNLKRMAAEKDAAMAYFMDTGSLKGYRPSATALQDTAVASRKQNQESGGLISSAMASETATPGGVRMMGPDGSVRVIPANLVGEAIAAGGKRVK